MPRQIEQGPVQITMQRSTFLERLQTTPPAGLLAAAFGLGGLIAYFDLSTGERFSLWVIYVAPVMLVAWFFGGRFGAAIGILAAMLSLYGGRLAQGDPLGADNVWLLGERIAVLVVVSLLTALLRRAEEGQRRWARLDALTGLENQSAFRERAAAEINRARRTGSPLTLAFLDCDNFKQINDTRGHLAGDKLLQTIAQVLASSTRSYDVVARAAGDEFLLLLPHTAAEAAKTVIERLQGRLNDAMRDGSWPVSFSCGVATFIQPPASVDELIHAADKAMYAVKSTTKNRANYTTIGT